MSVKGLNASHGTLKGLNASHGTLSNASSNTSLTDVKKASLAKVWARPTPFDLELHDKGDHLAITCVRNSVATWWLGVLRASFPQDQCSDDKHCFKMRPSKGIQLKLDRDDGSLKIKGDNHWEWFIENIQDIMNSGSENVMVVADIFDPIHRHMGMKDVKVFELLEELPRTGAVQNGIGAIYNLWKALIDKWLSMAAQVTLVTPSIDAERIVDVVLLMVANQREPYQIKLCTPNKCDADSSFKRVKATAREILHTLRSPHQKRRRLLSDEKIDWAFERLAVQHEQFTCKFIGMIKDNRAEVLVTSANFHKRHFYTNSHDTVSHFRLTASEFRIQYLEALGLEKATSL